MSRQVPLGLLSFRHFEKMHEDNHSPEQAQMSPTRLGGTYARILLGILEEHRADAITALR